jgi:hypothetical protein
MRNDGKPYIQMFSIHGLIRNVFFAKEPGVGGILEGVEHYQFIKNVKAGCHGRSK